ncbi:NAD-dependent epimerase/dehydratase family protein [Arhodomonas sp. AD133]|uniref:NAD-dependent epimerase/dehydratase family protein n=1 Tax=Arhodomonas sp. AD133 TaxID=3415009 RepID=UPI003EBBD8AF
MKVLITGATGFIGARLAVLSLEDGHEVTALGQVNSAVEDERREELRQHGIEIMPVSLNDREALTQAMAGVEVVFHLAAAQHEANVPDQHFWQVNVEGVRTLLEIAAEHQVRRFVHGSTIGVYGAALDGEIDEETPLRPDNIYGVTKAEGEKVVREFGDRLETVIVRISETFGPGDGRLLKLFRAVDSGKFFMIGTGRNKHQLIYVDDLVRGLWLAATRPAAVGKVLLLAGREVVTTEDMVSGIATALGARTPKLRAPLWPFMAAAVVMETALRPLGIQPPLHRRRMDFFRKSFYFSCTKTTDILGAAPATSFRDGARLTADWYRSRNWIGRRQ